MARPFHYHVYHRSSFDALPAWSPSNIWVEGLSSAAQEKLTVYSLQKDMDQLRADGAGKGIVDGGLRTLGKSARGKELWVLKVGNGASQPVLFTGCHHAREWISVEMVYLVAEYLIQNYKDAPSTPQEKRIKHLLLNRQIWFVPMVNPDGHTFTMSIPGNRNWRPNRNSHTMAAGKVVRDKSNGGNKSWLAGTFTGVDINRNYATADWGTETFKKGQVMTSASPLDSGEDSIWCGIAPSGEPESKIITKLIADNNFKASITYHSFSEDVLFPDDADKDVFVQWVGTGMTTLISAAGDTYTFKSGKGMYKTTGDLMQFSYAQMPGRPTYTPEVRPGVDANDQPDPPEHAFSGLPESEIQATFNENLPGALAFINCAGHSLPAAAQSTGLATASPPAKCQLVRNCWEVFKGWTP